MDVYTKTEKTMMQTGNCIDREFYDTYQQKGKQKRAAVIIQTDYNKAEDKHCHSKLFYVGDGCV